MLMCTAFPYSMYAIFLYYADIDGVFLTVWQEIEGKTRYEALIILYCTKMTTFKKQNIVKFV